MKIVALILGLAAAGAAVAGVVANAGSSPKTVKVTEKEFSIALSRTPSAGAVSFVVHNSGRYPHALSVAGPGVARRTPLIRPGASATLKVTLRTGRYSLWCPVPGHAAKGMKASFTVAGGTTGPAPGTSTGSGGGGGPAWG
ncbi:MAG TPA: hypothetical protein VI408_14335 [Gaiellaceae bacterium]